MKYLTLAILTFFLLNTGLAQNKAPKVVEDAFANLYSTIENPFWEHREGTIVAMFNDEDGLKKVFFNNEGKWLETRTRMELKNLPTGVFSYVDLHYKDADVTFAGKVDRPDGIFYRVESEMPSKIIVKLLNEAGGLVEQQKIDIYNTQKVHIIGFPSPVDQISPIELNKL